MISQILVMFEIQIPIPSATLTVGNEIGSDILIYTVRLHPS